MKILLFEKINDNLLVEIHLKACNVAQFIVEGDNQIKE